MKDSSQLLKLTEACMATAQMPLYSSKFSKRAFTQPQLAVLYCLKIKLDTTYRELVDWLSEMPRIRQALGLKRLPHFTTVQKAFQRLSRALWQVLQRISATWLSGDGVAGVDASGWDRSYASRYYTQRVKLKIRALKTTLLVDTGAQTVLDLHVTTTRKHDTQIAPRLTERNLEQFATLVADKGYDDRTHRLRLREQGKRPLIRLAVSIGNGGLTISSNEMPKARRILTMETMLRGAGLRSTWLRVLVLTCARWAS